MSCFKIAFVKPSLEIELGAAALGVVRRFFRRGRGGRFLLS
jgi:hypothetical protein